MRSPLLIIALYLSLLPATGVADIIYFKDGMRTVCRGGAWEEKDEVKCDYDGVILTYRQEDVEHIHNTIMPEENINASPPSEHPTADTDAVEKPATKPISNFNQTGTAFYDPRRPYKYWSSYSAKHHTYREAIDALAREFGRPARWIEERIGETNNLDLIRKSLTRPEQSPAPVTTSSSKDPIAVGDLFYNPRREYKYRIGPNQEFHTYQEAIEALAQEFTSTPQWVEDNMGASNDITAIRDSLNRRKAERHPGDQ